MSDKKLNFSELFENSKTTQVRPPSITTIDKEQLHAVGDDYYIENISFNIIDSIPKSHKKAGVNSASLRRFKRNYDTIKGHSLDLHGYTRLPAIKAVSRYIAQCQSKGILYFLVIFGKGLSSPQPPLLKKIICSYLISCREVLAYEFAAPSDGGDGAAYVMLRRQ